MEDVKKLKESMSKLTPEQQQQVVDEWVTRLVVDKCVQCVIENDKNNAPQRCNPCPRGVDFESSTRR